MSIWVKETKHKLGMKGRRGANRYVDPRKTTPPSWAATCHEHVTKLSASPLQSAMLVSKNKEKRSREGRKKEKPTGSNGKWRNL